jgi:hypothetical protein
MLSAGSTLQVPIEGACAEAGTAVRQAEIGQQTVDLVSRINVFFLRVITRYVGINTKY